MKQLEKLDLEVENLRKKNRWEIKSQFLPPILAMLLGVGGLIFTFYQFRSQRRAEQDKTISEQQKDRIGREVDQRTKLQNQIRTDIDELLRFTRDDKQTVARVSFLIEDIKTVLDSSVYVDEKKQTMADAFPGYKRRLTESLVVLVRDDCDFVEYPRDVRLANTVIGRWEDYSVYLKGEPEKFYWIVFEYIRALQSLRDQNPGYLEGMRLEEGGFQPGRRYANKKSEKVLYDRFIDILDGFDLHINKILDKEDKRKEQYVRIFQSELHNRTISENIVCTRFNEFCRDDR